MPSTIAYAEITRPTELLRTLLEHPVHERVQADPTLAQLYAAPQMLQVKAGIAFLELQLGLPYAEVVDVVAGGGISFGFDPKDESATLILKSPDKEKLDFGLAAGRNLFQSIVKVMRHMTGVEGCAKRCDCLDAGDRRP